MHGMITSHFVVWRLDTGTTVRLFYILLQRDKKMEKRKRIISRRRTARRIAEAVAEDYDETEREKERKGGVKRKCSLRSYEEEVQDIV